MVISFGLSTKPPPGSHESVAKYYAEGLIGSLMVAVWAMLILYGLAVLVRPYLLTLGYKRRSGRTWFGFSSAGISVGVPPVQVEPGATPPPVPDLNLKIGWHGVRVIRFQRRSLILLVGRSGRFRRRRLFTLPETAFGAQADQMRFNSMVSSQGRWYSRLRRL
jgi:hypothetical protein